MPYVHGQGRTRAERDTITVEIGYALISAAFAAAVVFGAVAGPALLFSLPGALADGLLIAGRGAAVLVFAVRVVTVLWRFAPSRRRDGAAGTTGLPAGGAQPSQPGRTRPDS
ncbi:DUF6332 family protein [Streptomyces qinzhouensis]|uniref:Uncharacterized protein n=1 Tax=Streptomyces qinzhouensis TaxID=2599401 RepID=A0A5B8ICD4_9ACTN|nr:DUF6332 family protein [Streptomyces qinzhouensis]QDY75482.1 hypothetical protein FQU76_01990 [Streptomyces qinzhouensis]